MAQEAGNSAGAASHAFRHDRYDCRGETCASVKLTNYPRSDPKARHDRLASTVGGDPPAARPCNGGRPHRLADAHLVHDAGDLSLHGHAEIARRGAEARLRSAGAQHRPLPGE